ncbi:MAG TPA: hypothetical protein G4O14_00975 [Anaerolineae bacterium]|nr:hypothetical protein [Anaerolineae bacterium]
MPTTEPGRLAPTLAGEPPKTLERHEGCPFAPRCFKHKIVADGICRSPKLMRVKL